ncbi:MAG TPA: hypothetical protein DCM07_27280, partial [Planctomycetaceae bacterium]|nr:hypothetical protein [Planctomycetaceae bacterium]
MKTLISRHTPAFLICAAFFISLITFSSSSSNAQEKTEASPWAVLQPAPDPRPLPHTKPLIFPGDLSEKMIAGIDKFLLRQIAQAANERPNNWKRDLTSPEAYLKSIADKRAELSAMLGLTDPLVTGRFAYIGDASDQPAEEFTLYEVSWPVLDDMQGTGLLLVPQGKIRGDIIAIPEADQL